eukprot:1107886-Prorocentrum_minimum.AAC.1
MSRHPDRRDSRVTQTSRLELNRRFHVGRGARSGGGGCASRRGKRAPSTVGWTARGRSDGGGR